MLKEAIERIIELARPEIVTVDGLQYATNKLHPVLGPRPSSLFAHTLTGIIDWMKAESPVDPMIQIRNETNVFCTSKTIGPWKEREFYIEAQPFKIEEFQFKKQMSIENAIVDIQSKFQYTEDKKRVIDFLSSIRGQQVTTAEDDGIAQEVTTSNKIGRLENTKMNPLVALAPYRTFTEIEQPTSLFLLRLQSTEKGLPTVIMFETDGGAWKNTAVNSIAEWFRKNDFVIENDIKIIA